MPVHVGDCPVQWVISRLSGKWKISIYRYLYHRPSARYSELQRHIPPITKKMLTEHLREMETDGLVARTVHPQMPPKVEYALTPRGRSMIGFLDQMSEWGLREYGVEPGQAAETVEPTS